MNELKNITQIRIHFKNYIHVNVCQYENSLKNKIKNQETLKQHLYKMNNNYNNYLFFINLYNRKYTKVIELFKYNDYFIQNLKNINSSNNDIFKIILLFTPHLLNSNNIISVYDRKPLEKDFPFILSQNKDLESKIQNFIKNYKEMETKGFKFLHREFFNYLEIFLNLYTESENIRPDEIKNNLVLHYFKPFIRPELYFSDKIIN